MEVASLEARYAPRGGDVLAKHVADEIVIVDMQSGIYHGLNPVGAMIWEQLDGEQSLRSITAQLAAQFPDVEPHTIEADALALLQTLLDHALVAPR